MALLTGLIRQFVNYPGRFTAAARKKCELSPVAISGRFLSQRRPGRWLGLVLPLLSAWLVAGRLAAQGTGNGPYTAADSAAWLAGPIDSTALLDLASRRVGLTTYALRSDLRGRLFGATAAAGAAPWAVRYHLLADWLAAPGPGAAFFVRQETRVEVSTRRSWGADVRGGPQNSLEPFVQHQQNPAIRTAISMLGARAGWRLRLPAFGPGAATDSVSVLALGLVAGVRRDARPQADDAGPALGAEVLARYRLPRLTTLPGAPSAPLLVRLRALGAALGQRAFRRVLAEVAWETTGTPATGGASALRLSGGYRRGLLEDYQAGNVQAITSDTLAARVVAIYPIGPTLTLRSDNTLLLPNRAFAYRAASGPAAEAGVARLRNFGYRQREVQLREEVLGQWAQVRTSGQLTYTERRRTYTVPRNRLDSTAVQLAAAVRQEKLKDIRERTTAWITTADWTPRPSAGTQRARHTFSVATTAQLLRLDTPSDQNDQDRDEVYYRGRLGWQARWNPTFRTTLALAAEGRQFVFIKASQSAENYTERVVAYEPGFRWVPGAFSWQADFQLRAIYQVRALNAEQGRNRATRLLQWQQELTYRLPTRADWRLLATHQRRESRFGVLDWTRFAETPLDTTVANDYLLSVRHALPVRRTGANGRSQALRIGYRFFEQRVQQRAGLEVAGQAPQLIYRRAFTWQHGPEVRYERAFPARGLRLTTAVWLQRLSNFTRYREGQGFFQGAATPPDELARRTLRTDAYFDLALAWRWR